MTRAELQCLTFVQAYMAANGGVSPCYREITEACGWASKNSASRVVHQLVEKGFLTKVDYRARALEVTMGSPYSDIERAAIWWLLEAREGMTLPEIVKAVQDSYARHGIAPGEPDEISPDAITMWLVACWQNFGFHVGLDEVADHGREGASIQ